MKGYKRFFNIYPAWDYTREIEDLNKYSQKGWQLVKGGLFSNKFKKNDDMRYQYQIDFNTKIDDMGRYIETYREQGWEYVNSTFNGWHYFRKLYDADSSDGEYEIYNDSQSLLEMQSKWQKMAGRLLVLLVAACLCEIALAIKSPRLYSILLALLLSFEVILIARGLFVMHHPQRADGHKRSWNGMPSFFTIFIIGIVGTLVLMGIRGKTNFYSKSEEYEAISSSLAEGLNWGELKVTYSDFYEFKASGKAAAPITISLVNKDDGKKQASIRLNSSKSSGKKGFEERQILYLQRGSYILYASDFAGGAIDIHISVE